MIKKFEDIKAWQKARELVREIYKITNNENFAKDFSLKDQIRRAAISSMSNICEGFSRQTDKEFIHFLYVSKGSTSEVQSLLYAALDLSYISDEGFDRIYGLAEETVKLISGFIIYLKKD